MALTEITKVTGPGIHTLSNILSHNINSSGIITATKLVSVEIPAPFTLVSLFNTIFFLVIYVKIPTTPSDIAASTIAVLPIAVIASPLLILN